MSEQSRQEPLRHIPVRPDLVQLKHQAKDLLKAIQQGDPSAIEEFNQSHPSLHISSNTSELSLSDVQLALARSYGVASWPRLVHACNLIDAIWRDDRDGVKDLITRFPDLINENA